MPPPQAWMAALSFGFGAKPPPPLGELPLGGPLGVVPVPVPAFAGLDGKVTPCFCKQVRNAAELKPEPLPVAAGAVDAEATLVVLEPLEPEPHAVIAQLAASIPTASSARPGVVGSFTAWILSSRSFRVTRWSRSRTAK